MFFFLFFNIPVIHLVFTIKLATLVSGRSSLFNEPNLYIVSMAPLKATQTLTAPDHDFGVIEEGCIRRPSHHSDNKAEII